MRILAVVPRGVLLLTLIGDWFDRWRERHTEHLERHMPMAPRRWGWLKFDKTGDSVFFCKLPSYAWEESLETLEFCWHQRIIAWRSWAGWSIDLHPVPS